MMEGFSIGAALIMGLFGSLHCVAMCGGLCASLCAASAARGGGGARHSFALAYNAGRVLAYTALGGVAGALSARLWAGAPPATAQVIAAVVAGLTIVFVGSYLAGLVRGASSLGLLGRLAAPVFEAISKRLVAQTPRGAVGRGLAWGLMPCGLLYAALGLALASGGGLRGALTMLAFGIGTLPGLLAAGWLFELLQRASRLVRIRRAAGMLLMVTGAVQLAIAVVPVMAATAQGQEPHPSGCPHHAP